MKTLHVVILSIGLALGGSVAFAVQRSLAPVSWWNSGAEVASLDATGKMTALGGVRGFAGRTVPDIAAFPGVAAGAPLKSELGSVTLVDGGVIANFTVPFAYVDGGPALCNCTDSATGGAVGCVSSGAGASITVFGPTHSLDTVIFSCTGP